MRLYTGEPRKAESGITAPGSTRTAAGAFYMPRYLPSPGDYELSLDQIYVAALDTRIGSPFIPQVAGAIKLLPFLDAQAVFGPLTRTGLRGPVWGAAGTEIGWSASYRSEIVGLGITSVPPIQSRPALPGIGDPLALVPVLGIGVTRGAEARLEGLGRYDAGFGFVEIALSPYGYTLGHASGAGADYAVDLVFDRVAAGYHGGAKVPLLAHFGSGQPPSPFEVLHGVGARLLLTESFYVQGAYQTQSDVNFKTWHLLQAGFGFRPPSAAPDTALDGPH